MQLSEVKDGSTGQEAVLLYGGPKSGKTVFAGSFEPPIYIADFDNGISSIIGHPQAELIEYDTYFNQDPESPEPIFAWEDRVESMWKHFRSEKTFPYKTVVIDSATLLLKLLMNKAFKGTVSAKDQELKRVLGVAPARGHWNVQMAYFDQEVRRLLAMPCYKVLICHEDTTDPYKIRPLLTGKQKEGIFPLFSEIYHMENLTEGDRPIFVVRIRSNENVFAGSRLDNHNRLGAMYRWTDTASGLPIWDAFQRMLKEMKE